MATFYWVGGSGTWNAVSTTNWSLTSGGAGGAGVPGVADTVLLDANSGASTVTLGATIQITRLTLTGFVGTLDFGVYEIQILRLTGTCFTGAATFTALGTKTINISGIGVSVGRDLSTGGNEANALTIKISAGTDAVNIGTSSINNLDCTGFLGTLGFGSSAKTIYGNFKLSSTLTFAAATGIVTFAATSGTKTIETFGKTVDAPITFNGIGGTFAFQDALTQGSTRAFTVTNGTVQLKAGATSTVGKFATSGTTTKYLQSTTPGTQATLSQASGTVNANYLTIQDINATGGATWNSFITNQNVNSGNNSGWDFNQQIGRYIYTRRKNKVILPI